MKKILVLLILFSSCKQEDLSKQSKDEISKTDIAMSDLAVKEGFHKALLTYAEDSVIIPREGKLPIIGKANVIKAWGTNAGVKEITWRPYKVEASTAGDIGYSFGYWSYQTNDTITYGNYCTIWHKQKDGKWKFVYDGGNGTPNPLK